MTAGGPDQGAQPAEEAVIRHALSRGPLRAQDLRWALLLRDQLRRSGGAAPTLMALLRDRLTR